MNAILYTSNTGCTARYASLLGREWNLPVYDLRQAETAVPAGAEVIYLGWIMASEIKGYKNAAARYSVRAVCGVGMGATGTQISELRKRNAVPDEIPVFSLQGGFDIKKLRGVYRLMMNLMCKTAGKALASKADRTAEEDEMLNMMLHGGNHVCVENLSVILDWYGTSIK